MKRPENEYKVPICKSFYIFSTYVGHSFAPDGYDTTKPWSRLFIFLIEKCCENWFFYNPPIIHVNVYHVRNKFTLSQIKYIVIKILFSNGLFIVYYDCLWRHHPLKYDIINKFLKCIFLDSTVTGDSKNVYLRSIRNSIGNIVVLKLRFLCMKM